MMLLTEPHILASSSMTWPRCTVCAVRLNSASKWDVKMGDMEADEFDVFNCTDISVVAGVAKETKDIGRSRTHRPVPFAAGLLQPGCIR